ncbi:SDR family NAD(P)-dependent oxidoreductase [Escherichia coli]
MLDISPEIEAGGRTVWSWSSLYGGCRHVRDPASVAAAIKRAKEKEGRIDILVNNAGVCRLAVSSI